MAPQEARQGRLEAVPAQMFRTSDTRLQRRPSLANGRCGGRSRFNAVKILSLFLMTFLVGLFPTPQTRTRARAPPHTHTRARRIFLHRRLRSRCTRGRNKRVSSFCCAVGLIYHPHPSFHRHQMRAVTTLSSHAYPAPRQRCLMARPAVLLLEAWMTMGLAFGAPPSREQ